MLRMYISTCFKIIKSEIIDEDGIVYLFKSCEEHDNFKEIVEINSEFYKAYMFEC